MITVNLTSECRVDPEGKATRCSPDLRDALLEWLPKIPSGAVLSTLTVERGDQREPWPVLVGLRAVWTETCP